MLIDTAALIKSIKRHAELSEKGTPEENVLVLLALSEKLRCTAVTLESEADMIRKALVKKLLNDN